MRLRERNGWRDNFDGNGLSVYIQRNVRLLSEYKCSERHVYLWSCRFPCLLTFFYLLGSSHLQDSSILPYFFTNTVCNCPLPNVSCRSLTIASGLSHAMKCPPLSCSLSYTNGPMVRPQHFGTTDLSWGKCTRTSFKCRIRFSFLSRPSCVPFSAL